MYSPRDVRKLEFDELRAARKPSVQERWMGPEPSYQSSDVEEIEDIEDAEEEEGHDMDNGNGEGESSVDHKPTSILSIAYKLIRGAGNAILKVFNRLRACRILCGARKTTSR